MHTVSTTVKNAQPSPWIQSVLVTASEMYTISITPLHCPYLSSCSRHTSRTDSSPNTFPKMVIPMALLMCKEALWSCYSATHKQEELAVSNIEEMVHRYIHTNLRLHHWENYLPKSAVWSTEWSCMIVVSATSFRISCFAALTCNCFATLTWWAGCPPCWLPQRGENGSPGALSNQSAHTPLVTAFSGWLYLRH